MAIYAFYNSEAEELSSYDNLLQAAVCAAAADAEQLAVFDIDGITVLRVSSLFRKEKETDEA